LTIERALLVAAALLAGCGDDGPACGPGDAPADGITVTAGADVITYGDFGSGANRDCGLDSITLDGVQVDPQVDDFHITFCIPDPAGLPAEPIALADPRIMVINVSAEVAGCVLSIDRTRELAGTIALPGLCDGGLHEAGYAIALTGTVPGERACPGVAAEPVDLVVAGEAAVVAR
jgi:hypothetical protein